MEQQAGDSWGRERLLEALDAFRRGVGEPPLLRKWTGAGPELGPVQKDDGPGPRLSFVLSTDEVDRHGDVISADGWNLESYRSNPVFLWAHDYARPVIGRALQTWTDSRRLMAQMEFAPTPFAQEVAMLYAAGYQRGVSVGFKPLSYEERRHEKTGAVIGIRFLEQELLEASAVPVPANRNALRRASDRGAAGRGVPAPLRAGRLSGPGGLAPADGAGGRTGQGGPRRSPGPWPSWTPAARPREQTWRTCSRSSRRDGSSPNPHTRRNPKLTQI